MKRYVAAVDDTGGIEPLYARDGTYQATNTPYVGLGFLIIKEDSLAGFEAEWNELRSSIQKYLALDYLPPIHQRHMYGRSRPERLRAQIPNPYLNIPHQNIKEWILAACEVTHHYSKGPYAMASYGYVQQRTVLAKAISSVIQSPEAQAEHRLIQKHVRSDKVYRAMRNRLFSPLVPLIGAMLPTMNNLMDIVPDGGELEIRFDPFEDSKGFDAEEVLKVATNFLGLARIGSAHRALLYDHEPLLQACDLRIYFHRRATDPATSGDPFLREVAAHQLQPFIPPKRLRRNPLLEQRVRTVTENHSNTLHYAVVYNEVLERDRNFAEEFLATPTEMNRRFNGLSEANATTGQYVSLLKIPELAKDYQL